MSSGVRTHDSATEPAGLVDDLGGGCIRKRYRRVVERMGHTRWFATAMRSVGAHIDTRLYRRSGGRLSIAGPSLFPVLLLTTTGRRSGRLRTTPVIYARDGDALIVSSESFGQKRLAAWPLNLEANPRARVQVGRRSGSYVAQPAAPTEIERYWAALRQAWPAHETYYRRSGVRKVYVLRPEDDS